MGSFIPWKPVVSLRNPAPLYGVGDIMGSLLALQCIVPVPMARCPYGWKLNTLYHELSHRILSTDDVTMKGGGIKPTVQCQQLAAYDPDDALNNASNWAFFICAVNSYNNDEA